MPNVEPRTVDPLAPVKVLAAVLRAAARVSWHEPSSTLPALASRLRESRRGLAGVDPEEVLPVLERLLPILPPFGAGRCMKRSLLLLDLWSRAGLEPALHLGLRRGEAGASRGHAWVTTRLAGVATFRPEDVQEIWRG